MIAELPLSDASGVVIGGGLLCRHGSTAAGEPDVAGTRTGRQFHLYQAEIDADPAAHGRIRALNRP